MSTLVVESKIPSDTMNTTTTESEQKTSTTEDKSISWNIQPSHELHTSLVGFLMLSDQMLKLESIFPSRIISGTKETYLDIKYFMSTHSVLKCDFKELISMLQKISGQGGSIDCGKIAFRFMGVFQGIRFTLYDYYQDESIHIGAPLQQEGSPWLSRLKSALVQELDNVYKSIHTS